MSKPELELQFKVVAVLVPILGERGEGIVALKRGIRLGLD
jgi:hypothetical protein